MTFRTPYVPHLYGDNAVAKLRAQQGWLTAGVVSSAAWPKHNVWLQYDGREYVLTGAMNEEEKNPPCIMTPCTHDRMAEGTERLYKFVSVLGWFKRGFVDITGTVWGSRAVLYGSRDTFTTLLEGGKFDCNYLPVIDNDRVRIALAFMREGMRLRHVNKAYSFLSFFKVLESQFSTGDRIAWTTANLDQLTDEDAKKRIAELRAAGLDVGRHLFDSGRCAIAHASLGGDIVDPDIWADRRRIAQDLDVMMALAVRYMKFEANVPDESAVYRTRDRTIPWHALLTEEGLRLLRDGAKEISTDALGTLPGSIVSVRYWPDDAPALMSNLQLIPERIPSPGVLVFALLNERGTMLLRFALDLSNGKVHHMLEDGGLLSQSNAIDEAEVEHYTRYFHRVVGNALVELCIEGVNPVQCEVVIPRNIIPRNPEEAVTEAVADFRRRQAPGAS